MVAKIRLTHDETASEPLLPLKEEIQDGYLGHLRVYLDPPVTMGSCKFCLIISLLGTIES